MKHADFCALLDKQRDGSITGDELKRLREQQRLNRIAMGRERVSDDLWEYWYLDALAIGIDADLAPLGRDMLKAGFIPDVKAVKDEAYFDLLDEAMHHPVRLRNRWKKQLKHA